MSQQQPVRAGDVYPASADRHQARRDRDRVVGQGHQQDEQRGRDGGGLQATETDLPGGKRMVTASAGGQVMAQFTGPVADRNVADATDAVTVGEALEAAAQTSAGGRPVGPTDTAAVQAAEMRAAGRGGNVPGGVAAAAQRAAEANAARGGRRGAGAVTLGDVVGGAAEALPANKVATRQDAERVAAAAARNEGRAGAGVVEAVTAAADRNESG
ncbi:hypothetical protein PVAP13_1KG353705 [Panicum virgatum]|uniref:SMP domain-containing protein n=1 Tax=Panicum virgatum TaxID=38727 RepID=A0A8T0XQD3_PANVG|nr:hypothetical protein PVAP13_1KG353705 [Panicum virgatum]